MRNRRYRRNHTSQNLLNKLKITSKILIVLIIFLIIVFSVSILKHAKYNTNTDTTISKINQENNIQNTETSEETNNTQNTQSPTNEVTKKSTTINMALTGDIMCHNTIYKDAYNSANGNYDFSYIFDDIKYHIQTADIAVGNLETTFAGASKGYSSYPMFNTPENLSYTLKKVGFDVLSTANNHCYDSGYKGIESTIDFLDDADISHTGTYKSEEDQNTILLKVRHQ